MDHDPQTNRCCQFIFAVGVIILLLMLWNDYNQTYYTRMGTSNLSGSACLKSGLVSTKNAAANLYTSAKQTMYSGFGRSAQKDDSVMSPPASVERHMGTDEMWLNTKAPEAPAGTQNDAVLDTAFVWGVPCDTEGEVESKFDQVKINKSQVKMKASIRPFGLDTASESPTHFRKTGMTSPMHQLHIRGGCKDEKLKEGYFHQEVPAFNVSEAHWQAKAALRADA